MMMMMVSTVEMNTCEISEKSRIYFGVVLF